MPKYPLSETHVGAGSVYVDSDTSEVYVQTGRAPIYTLASLVVNGLTATSLEATTVSVGGTALTATSAELNGLDVSAQSAQSVTATADGTGTGVIPAITRLLTFYTVVSANNAHILTLPAPVVGAILVLAHGANDYELQSSAPGTVAINGNTPTAGHKSTIAANKLVIACCTSATTWQAIGLVGTTLAAVEAAH